MESPSEFVETALQTMEAAGHIRSNLSNPTQRHYDAKLLRLYLSNITGMEAREISVSLKSPLLHAERLKVLEALEADQMTPRTFLAEYYAKVMV